MKAICLGILGWVVGLNLIVFGIRAAQPVPVQAAAAPPAWTHLDDRHCQRVEYIENPGPIVAAVDGVPTEVIDAESGD